MECHITSTSRQILLTRLDNHCGDKHISWFLWPNRSLSLENINGLRFNVAPWYSRKDFQRLSNSEHGYCGKRAVRYASWRILCSPVTLEEEFSSLQSKNYSNGSEHVPEASSEEEVLAQTLNSEQLKSLLADSERAKIIKKLSEANQQNRYLKRQLYVKEDALVNFKTELAVTELEIQALVNMAKEIANYAIPEGSRKINGRYIQSHLLSRLEALQEKMKLQIKDVELAESKEVPLFWSGMAESVQVMGTFDGWSQGEQLSPEYTGSHTRFSTAIMLRPGRYEIKFLVDGEWHLSPEYPIVGEGLMKNNLLIVE